MVAQTSVPRYGTAPVARSATIVDGTVVTADLANGAVTAEKTATAVQTSLGKADTAYQKPGTGIPESDLAAAVSTSLGLADTAVQPWVFVSTGDVAVTAVAGRMYLCSTADNDVSITLPSAATAGAGARVGAKVVTADPARGVTVLLGEGAGNASVEIVGETVVCVSDGAVWRVESKSARAVGTGAGQVSAGDHTHTMSAVTDAGGAATLDVGTTAGTVCAGDDARLQVAESTTLCTVDDSEITTAETATFTCTPDPTWVTAKVEPAGTIQLYRAGSTAVGTAQTLVSGTVAIEVLGSALGEGVHTITAVFTPDPTTPWLGSTSAGVEVTVSEA